VADEPERLELGSADLAADKLAVLQEHFPGVVADGVVDAARLAEMVGLEASAPKDARERYGLMWAGKGEAVQSLLQRSRSTLVPDVGRSIDPDMAENVFIEGDNLEVLKLLQRAYNDQVKLIYIDPPYNTGNDFVYNDDFSDPLRRYLEYSGQLDDGGRLVAAGADVAGRRHSRWLSMMYPRLHLARNVLRRDGVIAVSIDRNEYSQLKLLMDEVFGDQNAIGTIVWVSNLKGRQISDGGPVGTHEYILLYARDASCVEQFRGSFQALKTLMPTVYKGAGYTELRDDVGPYVLKNQLYNTNSKFNENTAPTMVFRIHYNQTTGDVRVTDVDDETTFPGFVVALPHSNSRPGLKWHAWRWSRAKVLNDSGDLHFKVDGDGLRIWTKVRDVDGTAVKDIVIGPSTASGQNDLSEIGMARIFDNPKPVELLQVLIAACTSDEDLVLDFFGGSGTTGHAVVRQNIADGHSRKFLVVNLPEPTPVRSEAAEAGFGTVSEIAVARLRIAVGEYGDDDRAGLQVLTLAPSLFKSQEVERLDLFPSTRTSVPASELDLAVEVMLTEGVRLDEQRTWVEHDSAPLLKVSDLVVVLSAEVTPSQVDAALNMTSGAVVFLEDSFTGRDDLKASAYFECKQRNIQMKTV
jgi:adenine-specific DNA-methyltransferase